MKNEYIVFKTDTGEFNFTCNHPDGFVMDGLTAVKMTEDFDMDYKYTLINAETGQIRKEHAPVQAPPEVD
jgi:hypothetical protein